uniref:4-hydroxy-tetrahydrodipicolinate synthase n=1 Tax=Cafeteria roenbergensis TaxID=33653 RepID=A0A7S0PET9_CAFRO
MAAAPAPLPMAGVYTALVTPFNADESIAWGEYEALLALQLEAGVDGVVICGTTAESPTLTSDEKKELISRAIKLCAGKCQVIAGTGSNNTAATVEFTRWAKGAGADACLVVNPYYNKPQQAGLVRHVKAVAAVGLPIMLYNIPGRSACLMETPTVLELAALPEVVAVKDSTGGLDIVSAVAASGALPVLSGGDALAVPTIALGGAGLMSVASNIVPKRVVAMVRAALAGDFAGARAEHYALLPLFKALTAEINPVPAKYALQRMGLISSACVRAPLAELGEASKPVVEAACAAAGAL